MCLDPNRPNQFSFDVLRDGSFIAGVPGDLSADDGPQVFGSRCCDADFDPASPGQTACSDRLFERSEYCQYLRSKPPTPAPSTTLFVR